MKRPSFQFYPGDWLRDTALRTCSIGARGLWIDMICLMHEGSVYGHLKVKDKAISDIQIARMTGGEIGEVRIMLSELEDSGVLSRTDDGVIYSRRMVKDEELRLVRAAGGKEGGNPKLGVGYNKPGFVYAMMRSSDGAIKIGISQDPSKRLYKIKAQYPDDDISVIGKLFVEDMGAVELKLHIEYGHCKSGEWFRLTKGELENLLDIHLKGKQTPASASASSFSKEKQAAFALPDWVCKEDWDLWVSVRKKMNPQQKQKQVDKLNRWRLAGLDYGKALSDAAANGWQGLIEPKVQVNGQIIPMPAAHKPNPIPERKPVTEQDRLAASSLKDILKKVQ